MSGRATSARPLVVSFLVAVAAASMLALSCASERDTLIVGDEPRPAGPLGSDASAAPPPAAEGILRCASNECPPGLVTCPNSPFPCGVDLMSDDDNCGACGVRCPNDKPYINQFQAAMRCVGGVCQQLCTDKHADCNGLVEDGCEVLIAGPGADDKNNCGACGNVCDDICINGSCGCPGRTTFCPETQRCTDLDNNNDNCGACGNVCPPSTDPPIPASLRMARTCRGGVCNQLACAGLTADCNGTFADERGQPEPDGCETRIGGDPKNCGGCGNVCAPGEVCTRTGHCVCPCGAVCDKSLDWDPNNCGTCGFRCPGDWSSVDLSGVAMDPAHGRPTCEHGVCGYTCTPHWADCDNDTSNGCETDLRADSLNCGACGVRCEGMEGQPCVDGTCLTKECEVQ